MNFKGQGDAGNWLISRKVQQVESDASRQLALLKQATTIEAVVRAANVSVPAEIRFMRNTIPDLRRLKTAAETRIEELLKVRLEQIAKAPSAAEAKALRGRFIQDCSMLRGNFSREYGHAERESLRLVYLLERAEKPVDSGQGDPPKD